MNIMEREREAHLEFALALMGLADWLRSQFKLRRRERAIIRHNVRCFLARRHHHKKGGAS